MYQIPPNYFFRLHQIRPRFKNDIENVLLYISTKISNIKPKSISSFNQNLFNSIKLYTGNSIKSDKTIDNWRTEISSLFGFIEKNSVQNIAKAGNIAIKLSKEQDLVQFFKYFLFYFQYPAAHIKSHKLKDIIDSNIHFKPTQYFLKVFEAGEKITKKRFSLNKAEATHFIYNDLRVTRDNCSVSEVIDRIIANRNSNTMLDWSGDIIRYAGDILDYMLIADLLVKHGNNYYINWGTREVITSFLQSDSYFNGYDKFYKKNYNVSELKFVEDDWFRYVNNDLGGNLFKTDVLKYLGIEENSYLKLLSDEIETFENKLDYNNIKNTKEIGDFGESLIIGHENMRIKLGGRSDLLHIIKKIPTHFAVGYDIQSVELDAKKRYIEVKSTISSKSLNFYNFHLTPNEWATADTLTNRYFVYRLMISKHKQKLFIIQDPISQYKKDNLKMSPRYGADIIFSEKSGKWSELLIWKK